MIIGISGKAGSGKDTVFSMINLLTGNKYTLGKFAGPLKELAAELLDVPVQSFEQAEFKARVIPTSESGMTYRDFLLVLGGDLMRGADPNYWVKKAIRNASSNTIFTDCRYPNEAEMIKNKGGIVIRINRPDAEVVDHESDTALDDYKDFDVFINNNGTRSELFTKVENLVKSLKL